MAAVIAEIAKAKINLALHVLGRRDDGYHELDSVVAFAEIGDVLTISKADQLHLVCTGRFAGAVPQAGENIIIKAWHELAALFAERSLKLPAVHITLEKNLPVASGIGGGSADAAAMLRGLMRLTGQTLGAGEIAGLARSLGADVPVCFHGKACHMQGIGETISALTISVPRAIVLVNPMVDCPTAAVFAHLNLQKGAHFKAAVDLDNPTNWRNDLSLAALRVQPVIADVLTALGQEPEFGAVRMSGSGATCFGLANSMALASAAAARLSVKHPAWWVVAAALG